MIIYEDKRQNGIINNSDFIEDHHKENKDEEIIIEKLDSEKLTINTKNTKDSSRAQDSEDFDDNEVRTLIKANASN